MKNLIVFIMTLLLFGCSNEKEEELNLDVGFELSIVNSEGEGILNPNHANAIKEEDIKLFYVINGVTEEIYNPNLDNPRNFLIFEHENEYRIRIFQNHSETEEKPITYIQWNETDTDTIETIYDKYPNAIIQRKIWLNGELLWDGANGQEPFFKIIK